MTVGQKLKDARKILGLSQAEASLGAGIEQKDISLLENGNKKFIPNEYIRFLYNSGIDINTLYNPDVAIQLLTTNTPSATHHLNEPNGDYKTNTPVVIGGAKTKKGQKGDPPTDPPTKYLSPKIITVDRFGNENILYVPVKAQAGYLNGFGDPEYIEKLTSFSLPGLPHGTYRAFEVEGDSMYPTLKNREMVIGIWVEKLEYIREDRVYVLVTKTEGVIIKRLLNRVEKHGLIIAKSDATNDRDLYKNIPVKPEDIQEIWYATWHGGFDFQSPSDMWKRVNNHEADLTVLQNTVAQLTQVIKSAGLLK